MGDSTRKKRPRKPNKALNSDARKLAPVSANVSTTKGTHMSLTIELNAIDPEYFDKVARQLAGEHNYSDEALTTVCAKHRQKYPIYDLICQKIQNEGKPLPEETLIHAIGMEHMLRTLIVIGEKNKKRGRIRLA